MCAHDHYEDNPWREQSMYVLDSRNQMLFGYYAFKGTEFQRHSLLTIAKSLRKDGMLCICAPSGLDLPIPFFSLAYFLQVYEYLTKTKDYSLLKDCEPVLDAIYNAFTNLIDKTGLIPQFPKPFWNFYEWADYGEETRMGDNELGYDLVLNCMFVYVVKLYAKIKNIKIDLSFMKKAIKKTFYNKEKKLYISSTINGGYTMLANSFALLIGLGDKNLADKILKVLPLRMSIGRMKEDQFVIFGRSDYSREEMVRLARKLLEVINEPIKVYDESALSITSSISMCYYPSHGQNFKQLYGSLEIACYVCKRSGGNQFRIYSPEANKDESANMEYYYQIKEGIKNKEFNIYYQPIISSKDNSIYAIEGLLRWNHPTLGILSPFKFIDIMEQTGDINWVGLWGLETVVQKHIEIKKKFNKEIRMSLNLSPKQLSNPNLPHDFQKVLKKYRVMANQIILEIEEFAIFERLDTVQNNLKKLSEMGFSIAVDGIGLDYKALKKLEEHSIDIVKIDRDFLDSDDQNIKEKFIEILVDFSKKQNCTIISEGIEDYCYLSRAQSLNLEIFQGYLFAKPLNGSVIEEYIKEEKFIDILNGKVEEEKVSDEVVENVVSENKEETSTEQALENVIEVSTTEVKEQKKKKTKKVVEEVKEEFVIASIEEQVSEEKNSKEQVSEEQVSEEQVSKEQASLKASEESEVIEENVTNQKLESIDENILEDDKKIDIEDSNNQEAVDEKAVEEEKIEQVSLDNVETITEEQPVEEEKVVKKKRTSSKK